MHTRTLKPKWKHTCILGAVYTSTPADFPDLPLLAPSLRDDAMASYHSGYSHSQSRYQFQPSRSNISMAVQILLKALANLPRTDFVLLKSVLPLNLVSLSVVSQVPSPREGGPIGFRSFITSVFTGQINLCYGATDKPMLWCYLLTSW